ncbi:MAG TPA: hypothetical protein VM925_29495 [Labilithrix sp.]|nr:hypothetical protein [Labilithrix sp.]
MARELISRIDRAEGGFAVLASSCAVVIEGGIPRDQCERWVKGVYGAREVWTHDFGGEQFSLGRAFYTHFEEGKSSAYFAETAASDARVDAHTPGLQEAMRDLVARVVGESRAVQRRGWCGPGVHVFPPGGPVASRGGVRHFDTEGLPSHHVEKRRPAITLVAMLQTPETDGGLQVWDVRYDGHDHPTKAELEKPSAVVHYRTGDVVLIDSYRLHQIQPFRGSRDRISATVHAAQIDVGLWECWF